jgi:hypothetical protein
VPVLKQLFCFGFCDLHQLVCLAGFWRQRGRKEGRKEENWACFVGGRILLQQLEFLVISRFFAACF